MKVLLEILFILFLLYFGWNKPFSGHAARLTGATPAPTPAAVARKQSPGPGAGPVAPTTPKPTWIYDRTKLDRPQ